MNISQIRGTLFLIFLVCIIEQLYRLKMQTLQQLQHLNREQFEEIVRDFEKKCLITAGGIGDGFYVDKGDWIQFKKSLKIRVVCNDCEMEEVV